MGQYAEHLFEAFSVLFVVCGPLDNVPIFLSLTKAYDPARRRRVALESVGIAGIVLVVFALLGDDILRLIGVQLSSLEIAGGVLLLLTAIQLVMKGTFEEGDAKAGGEAKDIAVFPLAMPLIAGPEAIAAVVLLISKAQHQFSSEIGIVVVLLIVLFMALLGFLLADKIIHILGRKRIEVIARVLGVLLAALAVEFIIEGLSTSALFPGHP